MSLADIIIVILVSLIVILIIARMIYKRIKKDYCYDCSSKAGCQVKFDEIVDSINKDIKNWGIIFPQFFYYFLQLILRLNYITY